MATPFECTIFLDWFEYLAEIAGEAGISISWSEYNQALSDYNAGNYDSALTHAKTAVREARHTLTAASGTLKSISKSKLAAIGNELIRARGMGLNVDAFTGPLNRSLSIYDAEDYIASTYLFGNLYDDLTRYIAECEVGRGEPLSGTYDLPEGTTDILVVEDFNPSVMGWASKRVAPEMLRHRAQEALNAAGWTEARVLEVRYKPPRIEVFVYYPGGLGPVAIFVIVTVAVAIAGYFVYRMVVDWKREEEYAKSERHKMDIINDYHMWIATQVAEGNMSPDTASDLLGEFDDIFSKINLPRAKAGLLDLLMKILILVVGAFAAIKLIGYTLARRK